MPITAPYNFVPLSRKVFFPDWADQVSHDIPFEDGISGEIVCELTTQTPVYVRNGGDWQREDILNNPEAQSFFKVGDDFMIPGTSLKGMLRNVIEIATFGKMCRVDDHRYSMRDINDRKIYQKYFVNNYVPQSKAAWLEIIPGCDDWQLVECSYARVEQDELKKLHGTANIHGCASAVEKYRIWAPCALDVNFTSSGPMNQVARHPARGTRPALPLVYDFVKPGSLTAGTRGRLVFTGQPNRTKHMEFVFFNPSRSRKIDKAIRENFEFVHSIDGNIEKPNDEWALWKNKLNRGEKVPVFYLEEAGVLHSFGLAQMYKLPYTYGIHKTIENSTGEHLSDDKPDFSELLFGSVVDKQKGRNLKGRVSICHALLTESHGESDLKETVLGAPKPTYCPNYLEQPLVKDTTLPPAQRTYKTYMDADAVARGWKRYPARLPQAVVDPLPPSPSTNVATKFKPLHAGTKFSFRIKVHNLRPQELGALLWALEWGGNGNLCHSLGVGKSFGYGLVKISVKSQKTRFLTATNQSPPAAFKDCMQKFCTDNKICTDWERSEQVFHLTSMANPQRPRETADSQLQKLKTMLIENPDITERNRRNEFQNAKDRNNPQWLYPLETHVPPPPPPTNTIAEESWSSATLIWTKNDCKLTVTCGEQNKAAVRLDTEEMRKQFVPDELYGRIFEGKKNKPVKANVTVTREGNLLKILKIEALPQRN